MVIRWNSSHYDCWYDFVFIFAQTLNKSWLCQKSFPEKLCVKKRERMLNGNPDCYHFTDNVNKTMLIQRYGFICMVCTHIKYVQEICKETFK